VVALVGGLGWGGWKVAGALREDPKAMPAAARAVPLQSLELKTDGALNVDWLAQTLALPKHASLMELDLVALRDRLLADGQVISASLTRRFPNALEVRVRERTPVARAMAEIAGQRQPLLIARDGVVFRGAGHDAAMLDSLPWLDGVTIARRDGRFLPIAGMDVVADLLVKARLEADHLYRTWSVVSLARLEIDRELEVRTRGPYPVTVVFAANPAEERVSRSVSFLRQIAELDSLWDKLLTEMAKHPEAVARVDLSLGRQVPVAIEVPAPAALPGRNGLAPAAMPALFSISPSSAQPRNNREL
jgi:cell division protein FtsQ